MNIDKSKIDKNSTGEIEIIDIKLDSKEIEDLLKQDGFYPAYHMNKKSWITAILNNTVSDEKLMELIKESYSYTITNKNNAKNEYKDKNMRIQKVMKIDLIKRYEKGKLSLEKLKEFGINAVRGPRYMSIDLSNYINKM